MKLEGVSSNQPRKGSPFHHLSTFRSAGVISETVTLRRSAAALAGRHADQHLGREPGRPSAQPSCSGMSVSFWHDAAFAPLRETLMPPALPLWPHCRSVVSENLS